jgi:hypothetical protein
MPTPQLSSLTKRGPKAGQMLSGFQAMYEIRTKLRFKLPGS